MIGVVCADVRQLPPAHHRARWRYDRRDRRDAGAVIEATWRNGIQTLTSCQDAGESNQDWVAKLPHMADYVTTHRGWAFIDFMIDDGVAFGA